MDSAGIPRAALLFAYFLYDGRGGPSFWAALAEDRTQRAARCTERHSDWGVKNGGGRRPQKNKHAICVGPRKSRKVPGPAPASDDRIT